MSTVKGSHVGFSGTRKGMTNRQRDTFRTFIKSVNPVEFHHGDCEGADAQADYEVHIQLPTCEVIIHPPVSDKLRAYCTEGLVLPTKPYLTRNRDIVMACGLIVICPATNTVPNPIKGGTWYTYDYAFQNYRIIATISVEGILRFSHRSAQGRKVGA